MDFLNAAASGFSAPFRAATEAMAQSGHSVIVSVDNVHLRLITAQCGDGF